MAQIPRPPKQGSVSTYVAKVAAGYTKILAGEMDADLDTIYGAWNGGADTVNLRDSCVTSAKIAADAVGPRELADGGIFTVALADGAVTTPKLATGAVTSAKLAAGAVTTPQLGDAAVTDAKIVSVWWGKVIGLPGAFPPTGTAGGDLAGSYPNPAIRDGAVTAAKLAADAVSGVHLAAGTVTTRELADLGVATGDLATGAVTRDKIAIGHANLWQTGAARGDSMELGPLNTEGIYLDYTWISRGGPYFILASLHCVLGVDATPPTSGLVTRIRLDGTAGAADGTILQEQRMTDVGMLSGAGYVPVTLTAAFTGIGQTAGAHRIKVSAMPTVKLVPYVRILSGWSIMAEWA